MVEASAPTRTWRFAVPVLPVSDVAAAQRYYRDVLGFTVNWTWKGGFGSVGNGDVELFLRVSEVHSPVVTTVMVDNADAMYEEYVARGARIVEPLESKPWGMREFSLCDLDGNVFRIGHGEKRVAEIADFQTPA